MTKAPVRPRLKVKNWRDFQHYKNRTPPWIKLHKTLLDDYDYACLPDASKALAPYIWLLASESDDGSIPADFNWIGFRVHMPSEWVESAVKPLIEKGFLEDASNVLSTCYQDACLETETETETEEERETRAREDFEPEGCDLSRDEPTELLLETVRDTCKLELKIHQAEQWATGLLQGLDAGDDFGPWCKRFFKAIRVRAPSQPRGYIQKILSSGDPKAFIHETENQKPRSAHNGKVSKSHRENPEEFTSRGERRLDLKAYDEYRRKLEAGQSKQHACHICRDFGKVLDREERLVPCECRDGVRKQLFAETLEAGGEHGEM